VTAARPVSLDPRLDATAQAALVARGDVTPLDLVEAAIARAERVNGPLNAIVTPLYERARAAAAGPLPDGPFRGVPFLLKDLQAALAGVRMTSGSRSLADFVAPIDTELVRRHKTAGLVIIGKTNTPELGILPVAEPQIFGPARNPWNLDRTPGGSSGGSAAAVAAGIVPMAHANDGGGSIRIPASCCGLFGLKPTRGRISYAPLLGDVMNGLVVEHAVTRSVRDSARLLDCTAGPAPGDPYVAPPSPRPFADEVGRPPGRLRIAWTDVPPIPASIDPACREAVRDAVRLCEELGHEVEEAAPSLPGDLIYDVFIRMWVAGVAWSVDGIAQMTGRAPTSDAFEPLTWAIYLRGREIRASEYLAAVTVLQRIARQVAQFFGTHDVWLTPTIAQPPIAVGQLDGSSDDVDATLRRAAEFVPFTALFNATGQPAMNVPLHWSEEGLPIGVQFAARYGDEATLFRLAAQLEEARPWADRTPPVWPRP
jgi:amidase